MVHTPEGLPGAKDWREMDRMHEAGVRAFPAPTQGDGNQPLEHRMIRAAVVLTIIGMLLLIGILVPINALTVGLFMLGSLLITLGIALYLIAVLHELRQRKAL
jgi:uncharacterized membrane protein YphA (DoxX/SURF4 family)